MKLNYVLQLRLEEIALRKVVVMLWNQTDFLSQTGVNNFGAFIDFKETFEKDVDRVKAKLLKLKLAKLLENKVTSLIEIVGLEIKKWKNFHLDLFNFHHTYFERTRLIYLVYNFDRVLEKLAWTSVGTIDYQKTAEELIRCEMFDDFLLFKLACLYCLENYVPVLWEKLPDGIKNSFYNEKDHFQLTQSHLDAFWTSIFRYEDDVSGEMDIEPFGNISNFYQHAFEVAANLGSKAATEYFYQKLTNEEKEDSLLKTAKDVATRNSSSEYSPCNLSDDKHTDILCYLLSQMIPEKQMELVQAHPYDVSNCFLVWPWQDLFLDVAQVTLDFLPEKGYCLLLQDIWTKTFSRDTKLNLFEEFFRRSTDIFKSCFIDKEYLHGNFLDQFYTVRESEIILRVFRNIEPAVQIQLMFCDQGLHICCYLIQDENWNLLNLFIRETVLAKEHRELLKRALMSHISEHFEEIVLRNKLEKWEQYFFRLNEIKREARSKNSLEAEIDPNLK